MFLSKEMTFVNLLPKINQIIYTECFVSYFLIKPAPDDNVRQHWHMH